MIRCFAESMFGGLLVAHVKPSSPENTDVESATS
jgi:hypothetical protein